MSAAGGLKRNVVSNFSGYVISILIAFVISPIIIRSLGDARYGIWALVAQITAYYGLLDLGIRGSITHYTARYLARRDPAQLHASLATGFWFLTVFGALAFVVGAVLAYLFPYIFQTGGVDVAEIRLSVLIMSTVIALSLPMMTLSGALVGYERLDLVNGTEIVTRVLGAVAIYMVMKAGGGLVALALVQTGMHVARWVLTWWFLHRASGGFSIRPGLVRRHNLKDLAGYGGRSMAINIAQIVIHRTDLVVIGAFLGTKWVTVYTIGQMLVTYAASAASAVTFSFTPRLTHLAAGTDERELRRVYLLGARTAAGLAAPLAGCMLAFGSDFIRLWLGENYVTGGFRERSDVIMVLLLVAQFPSILQSITWQLLFATRKQGYLAKLNIGEAVFNLAISLVLVHHLGIVGVALGTLLPLLFTHAILLPRKISRSFGISVREFLREGVGRPLLVGAILFVLGTLVTRTMPPTHWGLFLVEAAPIALLGAVLLFALVLEAPERARVTRLFRRIVGGTR